MTGDVTYRDAGSADLPAVTDIYNRGIADRVATFETNPRSEEDVVGWLADGLPFMVAEDGDGVVGRAKVQPYSDEWFYRGYGAARRSTVSGRTACSWSACSAHG